MKILTSFRVNPVVKENLLEKYPDLQFSFQTTIVEAEKELESAEILITYGEDLTPELIEKARRLKWIMVLSAGLEKMPFAAIKQKDILVTNARGIHKTPMAEYTIGMMLQVARKTKELIELEKQEKWNRAVKMVELSGKTITIIGTGAIGCEIARLAKAFRMKTVGINRSGRPVEHFDEIFTVAEINDGLKQGDFVVSVLPSTPETYHLLKSDHFTAMKKNSVFINIGRGNVVAEDVLLKAIEDQEIAHAVLDVFEKEPLEAGHPFWKMENVTVTPHLSGISSLYQPRGFEIFEYNLEQYLSGENNYKNIIDLDRGY